MVNKIKLSLSQSRSWVMRSARPFGCIDFDWFVSGQGRQSARWSANITSAVRAFVLRPSSAARAGFRASGDCGRAGEGEGRETNGRQRRLYLAKKKKKRAQGGDVFPFGSCQRLRCLQPVCGPDQLVDGLQLDLKRPRGLSSARL